MTDAHCHISSGDPSVCELLDGRDFVGVHPWHLDRMDAAGGLDAFERALRKRLGTDPALGVGEIGLDRLRDRDISPRMREVFTRQLAVALDLGRPVVLHGAKCWGQVVRAVREALQAVRAKAGAFLFHGFSRSDGLLPDIVSLGGYVSVGPSVLNDHAVNYRKLVGKIPPERLLVETDRTAENAATCPSVREVLAKTAEIVGVAPRELERLTDANARAFRTGRLVRTVACVFALAAGAFAAEPSEWGWSGMGRVYFESAYSSSSGGLGYTKPVSEQYYLLKGRSPYGFLSTDAWIISALNDQQDASHRRAMYCYEGTLLYGYDLPCGEDVTLTTAGGILWDWLGGYRKKTSTPIDWYATQTLANPYVTPYWTGLGGGINTGSESWVRVRGGVNHTFRPCEPLMIRPYAELLWTNAKRYRTLYGEKPNHRFAGGTFPIAMPGVVTEWSFGGGWSLWLRYRHYFLIESQARDLVKARGRETDRHHYPIFGIGLQNRF